jgi:hypothetical protein
VAAAPMAGGGGRTVSRVRALGSNEKLLSVVRESVGPKILGHGDLMRDAPLVRASSFSSYGRHMYQGRVSHLIAKRDAHTRGTSCIGLKARRAPNGCVSFHLASSSTI